MRIFVAGATGAVGRELVPALVAAGHSVTGMTRTAAKADAVKRLGAEPVVADGLNAPAVHAADLCAKATTRMRLVRSPTQPKPGRVRGQSGLIIPLQGGSWNCSTALIHRAVTY